MTRLINLKKARKKKNQKRGKLAVEFDKSILDLLIEIHDLFEKECVKSVDELYVREAIKKQFGRIERGYGALISLRNTLRSFTKDGQPSRLLGECNCNLDLGMQHRPDCPKFR